MRKTRASMTELRIAFDSVRRIGSAMAGVEAGTAYGSPALKIGGKLLACIAIHKSAEPNSLALRIAFEDRAALINSDPDIYYLTPHYLDYPVVLVRLARVNADQLKHLLAMALKFVTSAGVPKRRKPAPSGTQAERSRSIS